ncbi:eukaryotic translation initiation factor 3 subunit e [Holotrichia oblita]|uniref:Eukaryotic translation initiation factor 3 subunit e n=1 Tax=Holotrichia oblita TaxID=644536 RepID=A0ACB9TYQ6_HOLOL|nr:eukaryotic translation initiation factor 3 subunit e [Holotrichia oblita]
MAKFDLTSRMGQYLDRHLVFPLLEFLSAKEIYDEQELLKAKLDILSKTNMVDYAIDIRKQLYPKEDVPEELKERRFEIEMIESLHKLAKYRYECGNYSVSTSYLYFCMLVLPPNDKNFLSVLWGKLASEILVQNWDSALEDLNKLRNTSIPTISQETVYNYYSNGHG